MIKAKYQKGQRVIAYIGGEWHSGIIISANKQYGFTRYDDRWEYAILLDKAFSLLPSLPKRNEFLSIPQTSIKIVEEAIK